MDFTECYRNTCSNVGLAARQGKHRLLMKLIRKGFSIDIRDNRGWNPLHEAAFSGAYECAQLLVRTVQSRSEASDYIDSQTHDSSTPLFLGATRGHLRLVRFLLRAGADVNKATLDEASPLFSAVDGGHREVVELLVQSGAAVDGLHSASGWTCLHQAAFKGHAEIVGFLAGMSKLDATDDFGITPLFVAAQYGQCRCLEILADAGANVNCQSNDLATPLLIASQEGHLSCVGALLERGADPNIYCNEDRWQLPIHAAAQFGRIGILEKLVPLTDRSCDRDPGKVSPVYSAVLGGQVESLRLLLREGFSPDAQDCKEFGFSSPLAAPVWPHFERLDLVPEMAGVLLEAGALVEGSLYHQCLRTGLPHVLELLLVHGGLPRGDHLAQLVASGLESVPSAAAWLPILLRAGLHPLHFLHQGMFEQAESDVLSFLLEFTNWKALPPALLDTLSRRLAEATWEHGQRFECLPSLSHLSRLAVREAVGASSLARREFVRRLPVPLLLQDYLQFTEVFQAHRLTRKDQLDRSPGDGLHELE